MRPYGSIGFSHDLTPHLSPLGKRNQIAVRVDNSLQPNCRWYSGSGIYRHTWLRITDPIHIGENGICIRTPTITPENATIEISVRLFNESGRDANLDLVIEIIAPTGEVVQQNTTQRTLGKNAEATVTEPLTVASPTLWSGTTPHLYQVRCTLHSGGVKIDQETTTFGIRHIVFDVARGFLLNGEHVKLMAFASMATAAQSERRCLSGSGSDASSYCRRWDATPSGSVTIHPLQNYSTCSIAWAFS
jgi:beta-galactosidase